MSLSSVSSPEPSFYLDDEDDEPEFTPQKLDLVKPLLKTVNKPLLTCNTSINITTTSNCTIPCELSDIIGQGKNAYVFKCSEYVLRISDLEDSESEKFIQMIQNQFLVYCNQPIKIVPQLFDAYICSANHSSKYGIMTMEKYDGNLLELYFDNRYLWNENTLESIRHKMSVAVEIIHNNNVVHNDIGWQNCLYRLSNENDFELVVTDFEDSQSKDSLSDRLWFGKQSGDKDAINNTIIYLTTALEFITAYRNHLDTDDLRELWQEMEHMEWKVLKKHLNIPEELYQDLTQ